MRKKIAIITIYGNNNYGNKLQNYALEQILISHDFDVETIRYKNIYTDSFFKNIYIKLQEKRDFKKINKFKKFSKNKINVSNTIYSLKNKKYLKYLNTFDYVSVGSDQVWNDTYLNDEMLEYFLLNGVENQKRIAMAPSVGGNRIINESKYSFELNKFKLLSCREKENVEMLNTLSNKNVIHLMDPTLYFQKEFWDKLLYQMNISNYIFLYAFDSFDFDCLNFIAKLYNNIEIINVLDRRTSFYNSGPSEFINYIKNSKIVVTNSFHAVVFSIIYGKDFFILNREINNMGNRIKNLISFFDIPMNFNGIYEPSKIIDLDIKVSIIREKWDAYISMMIS